MHHHPHRRFGGAVMVEYTAVGPQLANALHQACADGFTAQHQRARQYGGISLKQGGQV